MTKLEGFQKTDAREFCDCLGSIVWDGDYSGQDRWLKRDKMKKILPLILVLSFVVPSGAQSERRKYDQAMDKLKRAETKLDRFYALGGAAKASFDAGYRDQARWLAEELQRVAGDYLTDWNYGNAVHDVHVVLGRLAVSEGRIEDGKAHLLEAGKSPGSPQMRSFGPNMSLARDLLQNGQKDTVLKYFKLCAKFWGKKYSKLPQWTMEIQRGRIPDFGANLVY